MNASKTQRPHWRDLWAFVIYFGLSQIIALLLYYFYMHFAISKTPTPVLFLWTSTLTSVGVIGFLAWSHRNHLKTKLIQQLRGLKQAFLSIILAYVIYLILNVFLGVALKFLPKAWQFDNTSNQKALLVLFQDKSWLPFVFIVLVILTPITEELLFRHIIIGELGKKFGIWVMGAFSIFIFTFLHVKSATSPFEAALYLLMSCLFVIMYIRSRCNIAVSITLHMLVNGFSFLAIVMQSI